MGLLKLLVALDTNCCVLRSFSRAWHKPWCISCSVTVKAVWSFGLLLQCLQRIFWHTWLPNTVALEALWNYSAGFGFGDIKGLLTKEEEGVCQWWALCELVRCSCGSSRRWSSSLQTLPEGQSKQVLFSRNSTIYRQGSQLKAGVLIGTRGKCPFILWLHSIMSSFKAHRKAVPFFYYS